MAEIKANEAGVQKVPEEELSAHQLRQVLKSARAETAENWDKYLRAEAELENSRKRLDRLYSERAEEEKRKLLGRILQVKDDLERALNHEVTEGGFRQGVELIYRQVEKLLQDEGVEPIRAMGMAFDPLLHEAVDVVAGEGTEELVMEEVQRGYVYHGKLLRPSRVRVSKPS